MKLTKPIKDVNDVDKFKGLLEKKYGSKIVGHHQEQGIGVYEFASGDEVKFWDEKKLIGNPFGRRGKDNKIPAHFTRTKYSESGYKPRGGTEFLTNYTMSLGAGNVGYAKLIGLSDADIRRAYREGVGNAEDVRAALDRFASGLKSEPSKSESVVKRSKVRPNLSNVVGLHPSNKSWANFLLGAELRETKNGIRHYISSNGHYIVLPDGEVITFYGYHGQVVFDEIIKSPKKWLTERDRAEREMQELLHTDDNLSVAASQMGLTEEQLTQARREGVATAAGLRRIEKNSRGASSSTELQSIHDSRSELSRFSDERQSNLDTVDIDSPRIETWKRNPGSMDVRGIDTPRRRKIKSPPRPQPHQKHPPEMRGMR